MLKARATLSRAAVWVAALVVVASCASNGDEIESPDEQAAAEDTATEEAEADDGDGDDPSANGQAPRGDIRIDLVNAPATIDPLGTNLPEAQRIYRLATDTLLRWNEGELAPEPGLAEMPEISDDGLEYTFSIREGIEFHDGTPLTAADVAFTYETVMNPEMESVWRSGLFAVDSVEATDESTVVIRLGQPFTPIMSRFAHIPIVAEHVGYTPGETYVRQLHGTGPFVFEEYEDGQGVSFSRNDDYHMDGLPNVETVDLRFVSDDASRLTNLVNGVTHIVPDLPADLRPLAEDAGHRTEIREEGVNRVFLYPALAEGRPTADLSMRHAIARAIDRQAIIDTVFDGAAVPSAVYKTPANPYYEEDLGQFFGADADLQTATEYLEEAGGVPGEPLELAAINTTDMISTANIIQSNLTELGLEVTIRPVEFPELTAMLGSGEFDLILVSLASTIATGFASDEPFGGYFSQSPTNFNGVSDPQMDDLLMAAVEAEDGPAAEAAWREVYEYDTELLGQIQVVNSQYIEGVSSSLSDYEPSALPWFHSLVHATLAE